MGFSTARIVTHFDRLLFRLVAAHLSVYDRDWPMRHFHVYEVHDTSCHHDQDVSSTFLNMNASSSIGACTWQCAGVPPHATSQSPHVPNLDHNQNFSLSSSSSPPLHASATSPALQQWRIGRGLRYDGIDKMQDLITSRDESTQNRTIDSGDCTGNLSEKLRQWRARRTQPLNYQQN